MGVCSSCLGHRSKGSRRTDPSETTRLLNSTHNQYNGAGEISYRDFGARAEPERESQERDSFKAIWKLTSDHLIDVTQTSMPGEHESTTTDAEFATLFRHAFQRNPASKAFGDNQKDAEHTKDIEGDTDEEESAVDEQEWLRDIILRDSKDKSWDCNTVNKIGRPLIIHFDDS